MKQVKNISDQELAVHGVGMVKPEQVVSVPDDFHNGNFEDVTGEAAKDETKTEDEVETEKPSKKSKNK